MAENAERRIRNTAGISEHATIGTGTNQLPVNPDGRNHKPLFPVALAEHRPEGMTGSDHINLDGHVPVTDPDPDPVPVPISDPEPDPDPVPASFTDPNPDPRKTLATDPNPAADPGQPLITDPRPDPNSDPDPDPAPVPVSIPDPRQCPTTKPDPYRGLMPVTDPRQAPITDPNPDSGQYPVILILILIPAGPAYLSLVSKASACSSPEVKEVDKCSPFKEAPSVVFQSRGSPFAEAFTPVLQLSHHGRTNAGRLSPPA
ncbi:anther-specific proline-rich protein APG-like [Rhincodon typus]|uniref:anther-specific proline-rich protein APG-like n=1 Tax=Rhincodon typus TaxID=259920 RepID=UPI00202FC613|nr:anther-specific proline-rich protein APG-like [Rhincodon typus]